MNYWPRWIGDWKKKTAALSLGQKGAYGELLDYAYITEQPLPADKEELYRICGALSKDECAAVDKVVDRFFVLSESGYGHPRVSEELAKRHLYVEAQKERAHMRWHKAAKPAPKGNGEDHSPEAQRFSPPEWVPLEQWNAWMEVRRRIKAPNTERAMKLAVKDLTALRDAGHEPGQVLDLAISRGWRGLFAPKTNGSGEQAPVKTGPHCRKCGTTEAHSWIDGLCSPCWETR